MNGLAIVAGAIGIFVAGWILGAAWYLGVM